MKVDDLGVPSWQETPMWLVAIYQFSWESLWWIYKLLLNGLMIIRPWFIWPSSSDSDVQNPSAVGFRTSQVNPELIWLILSQGYSQSVTICFSNSNGQTVKIWAQGRTLSLVHKIFLVPNNISDLSHKGDHHVSSTHCSSLIHNYIFLEAIPNDGTKE